jgi:hypothetical protein
VKGTTTDVKGTTTDVKGTTTDVKGYKTLTNRKNEIFVFHDHNTKQNHFKEKQLLNYKKMNMERMLLSHFNNIQGYKVDITKNTVLIIEPRFIQSLVTNLANTYLHLGNDWNYVFYCGRGTKIYWSKMLPNFIQLRELHVNNFPKPENYSSFCKRKELWQSLYGEFVLTLQADAWITNEEPYTIEYFLNKNMSFIGGNMNYHWSELTKNNMNPPFRNFNGGLSLRKRQDMLKIIDTFPFHGVSNEILEKDVFRKYAEDVYFTFCCYKLKMRVGDDEESSHFSIHSIYNDNFFGIHRPYSDDVKKSLIQKYPLLSALNQYLNID